MVEFATMLGGMVEFATMLGGKPIAMLEDQLVAMLGPDRRCARGPAFRDDRGKGLGTPFGWT